jgi:hypothetical protein
VNNDLEKIACVQQAIEDILEEVNEGHVKGVMFQIIYDNDCHMTGSTNNLLYLEKLGLLESAKIDVLEKVRSSNAEDGDLLDEG